ncbi:MAG: class I SAM-dependent methyltransferase [Halobacteria archaeon]|nr:class I SAM-dependent methyltransferase [Halobacteria archaeon]
MEDEREKWNRKYSEDDFEMPDDPVPALERYIEQAPGEKAVDIATGTGRNAVFLAENGYDVDAIDISDKALTIARRNAEKRGVGRKIDWERSDIDGYTFPKEKYGILTMSFYYNMNRFSEFKQAVAPGGYFIYKHHLKVDAPSEYSGPSDNSVRLSPNEVLRACLDLRVLRYVEETVKDEKKSTVATVVARKTKRSNRKAE